MGQGEQNKLLSRQLDERDDPVRIRREETAKFLQQNPNATDKQINDFRKKLEGTLSMTITRGAGTIAPDQSRAPHAGHGTLPATTAPGGMNATSFGAEETNGPRRVQQLEEQFGLTVGGLMGDNGPDYRQTFDAAERAGGGIVARIRPDASGPTGIVKGTRSAP